MLSLLNSPLGFASMPKPLPQDGDNPCKGQKYNSILNTVAGVEGKALPNVDCFKDAMDVTSVTAGPQAGADVTVGKYTGAPNLQNMTAAGIAAAIQGDMNDQGLCAVNVHWHSGAEHRSAGEYDETGAAAHARRLSGREGHHCVVESAVKASAKFTTEYEWKHCKHMHVGGTYEIHWPHSAAGACGTKWQHQTPFYDGVLCKDGPVGAVWAAGDSSLTQLPQYVGVEAQVFVITNDPADNKNLNINGAIKTGGAWTDVAKYTGSTTGDSRTNEICSQYQPITWQVDRKCHMISAESFDQLCAEIETQPGMYVQGEAYHGSTPMLGRDPEKTGTDLEPHGARETVSEALTASNVIDGAN